MEKSDQYNTNTAGRIIGQSSQFRRKTSFKDSPKPSAILSNRQQPAMSPAVTNGQSLLKGQ